MGHGARALFVGDSYTSGWALADADVALRWSTLVADALGWEEINAGFPGAGYVASGPVSRAPYRQILPTLADVAPSVVIMSGGLNDLYADDARIATSVRSTMRALADGFPGSTRVSVTAVSPTSVTVGRLATLNAVLRDASAASGAVFLDIGEPLLASPDLVGPDGIHPTVAGHAALSARFIAALEASGLLKT
jgi:lysophospholipase L1-like esterase